MHGERLPQLLDSSVKRSLADALIGEVTRWVRARDEGAHLLTEPSRMYLEATFSDSQLDFRFELAGTHQHVELEESGPILDRLVARTIDGAAHAAVDALVSKPMSERSTAEQARALQRSSSGRPQLRVIELALSAAGAFPTAPIVLRPQGTLDTVLGWVGARRDVQIGARSFDATFVVDADEHVAAAWLTDDVRDDLLYLADLGAPPEVRVTAELTTIQWREIDYSPVGDEVLPTEGLDAALRIVRSAAAPAS